MTRTGFSLLALVCAALLVPQTTLAQAAGQLKLLPESRVWIEGTSNRDNWTVNATQMDGFVALQPAGNALRAATGRFSVASASLEGGRGPIMDRLMHGALKSGEHPNIVYELVSLDPIPAGAGKHRLNTRGRVTLAGVTKEIEAPAEVERVGGNLRFTGNYPLQMSDYGIQAPTAMFGALRTGDRVVIHFELLVKP
jgi:polyisoprenoid-binding protein YceI